MSFRKSRFEDWAFPREVELDAVNGLVNADNWRNTDVVWLDSARLLVLYAGEQCTVAHVVSCASPRGPTQHLSYPRGGEDTRVEVDPPYLVLFSRSEREVLAAWDLQTLSPVDGARTLTLSPRALRPWTLKAQPELGDEALGWGPRGYPRSEWVGYCGRFGYSKTKYVYSPEEGCGTYGCSCADQYTKDGFHEIKGEPIDPADDAGEDNGGDTCIWVERSGAANDPDDAPSFVTKWKRPEEVHGTTDSLYCEDISKDVVVISIRATLCFYSREDSRFISSFELDGWRLQSIAMSPDGQCLLVECVEESADGRSGWSVYSLVYPR